jgi:ComF family protein
MGIPYFNDMLQSFVSLYFPKSCLACSGSLYTFEVHLCAECEANLPAARLAHRVFQNPLTELLRQRFSVFAALSVYRFEGEGAVRKMLHKIKYNDGEALAFWIGVQLGEAWRSSGAPLPEVLIPVPLHPKKLRLRGFNQSERIARGIESVLKVPVNAKHLLRTTYQRSQTRLGRMQRWENIGNSFGLAEHPQSYEHIALVDDMITTGSTLESCALALKCKGLSILSVAYEA